VVLDGAMRQPAQDGCLPKKEELQVEAAGVSATVPAGVVDAGVGESAIRPARFQIKTTDFIRAILGFIISRLHPTGVAEAGKVTRAADVTFCLRETLYE
jgi:hypothetical protein